jgi:hypothetical protein
MSWRKRFTFRDKRSIKHEVSGQEFRFYPNRMALLTEARDLSGPIAKAINTLFADQSRDNGSNVKRQHEGEFFLEDISTQPLSIEMAEHRMAERNGAIEQILNTLADSRSIILLGRMFMDSLRDDFEYKKDRSPADVEEFLFGEEGADDDYEGLDMPVLIELFQGWMKANATVFGEAGESMVGLVRKKLESLQISESSSETTDPTNGDSSKTPSSPQSEPDSQPSTSTN